MKWWFLYFAIILTGCVHTPKLILPENTTARKTGSVLFKEAATYNWRQRDSMALAEIGKGNMPSFLKKFIPVQLETLDSTTNKTVKATIYVTPDYLSVGTDKDWVRIPLTPMAAQQLADQLNCMLPTRKMVDAIYSQAKIKLEPVPMYAFRDSTPTMYQHHLIIEGQRQGQKGLIGGIKKDIVTTGRMVRENRLDRVAIYGWHQMNGKPIQPLYIGHINWYTDYSHGVRFIYRKIKINQQWVDVAEVWQHPVWRRLICDEQYCEFYKYPY